MWKSTHYSWSLAKWKMNMLFLVLSKWENQHKRKTTHYLCSWANGKFHTLFLVLSKWENQHQRKIHILSLVLSKWEIHTLSAIPGPEQVRKSTHYPLSWASEGKKTTRSAIPGPELVRKSTHYPLSWASEKKKHTIPDRWSWASEKIHTLSLVLSK